MDLDDLDAFAQIDPRGMLAWIDGLPKQCQDAWEATRKLLLPGELKQVTRIVVAGMGGSAIGGSLVQALAAPECPLPITVVRDYTLPAFVRGPETLVIASSFSGNTEETLAAFDEAHARGARLIAQTGGGKLAERARAYGATVVPLPMPSPAPQPRAVVGYSFVALAGVLCGLGFMADKDADVREAVEAVRARQPELQAASPAVRNPAKRLAGQLVGRIPAVYGADLLAPVAQRWKGQMNENAKTWSEYDVLPELNHNAVVGIMFPPELMTRVAVVMLTSSLYHPRIQRRFDVTRQLLMQQGILIEVVKARGTSRLAQMLTTLHYGDYVSYYLAMANQVDPTPVPPIDYLKGELAQG